MQLMDATNPWGKALERLRLGRKPEDIGITSKIVLAKGVITWRQLDVRDIAGQSLYTQWLQGTQGPTVASLDKFLTKMGYTWHEWATIFEEEKAKWETQAKKKSPNKPGTSTPRRPTGTEN